MASILISTPNYQPAPVGDFAHSGYRGLDGQFAVSVEMIRGALAQAGHVSRFARIDACMVDRARSELVGFFLASDATHILWIDADIVVGADVVMRLLAANLPIVAATYPRRGRVDGPREMMVVDPVAAGGETVTCRRAPLGCSLMTREAVVRVADAHPELQQRSRFVANRMVPAIFQPMVIDGDGLSDDYAFCDRARAVGLDIHVLLGATVEHAGLIGTYTR